MSQEPKIYVAGHRGMVGSAILPRFLYVDDMAAASVHVMQLPKATYDQHTTPMQSHINVGFGSDVTIAEVAQAIAETVGFNGQIEFDTTKPDGASRKWMDSSRLNNLGWQSHVHLREGLTKAYANFQGHL